LKVNDATKKEWGNSIFSTISLIKPLFTLLHCAHPSNELKIYCIVCEKL